MKKKLKIIIPLVVIIIIAAVAAIIVFAGDKIAISGKSKVSMGLSKTFNSFDESEGLISNITNYKYIDTINSKPYDAEVKMSVSAEVEDLEELVGNEDLSDLITEVLDEVSNADITTKLSMDKSQKQAVIYLNANAENVFGEISGEMAITPEEIAFRSEEINEDYIVITKDDAEENSEYEAIFDFTQSLFKKDFSNLKFSEEEIKHFKDTYGSIFKESITDDMITSEKSDFEVNGSSKSCTKSILTLNNDKLKEIISKYITTYENDEKGKEIIETKFNTLYGEEIASQITDQLNDAIDSLKESVDEIEGANLEFITYGSVFKVYGTEVRLTIDEETLQLVETFNDADTKIIVSFEDEELANFTIKQSEQELSIEGTISVEDDVLDVKYIINKEKIDFNIGITEDGEAAGKIGFTCEFNTKKDTENEFEQDAVLKMNFDIPSSETSVSGNVALKLSQVVKAVDSIDFPDTSNSISITDEDGLADYVTDSKENLEKYLENIQSSDIYNDIMAYSGSSNVPSLYDETITLPESTDTDVDFDVDTDVDPEDLESDINEWYTDLEPEEGLSKSEIIEENMISEYDFWDDIKLTKYISWEKGSPTDKGYLGLKITDSNDNSYEFYIDLSTDTVYSESTVPFDTSTITWNEY